MRQKIVFLILITIFLLGVLGYIIYHNFQRGKNEENPTNFPSPTENITSLTQEELSRGWYWASSDQKKPGTPNNWVFDEAGRSSCWHRQDVECNPN